LGIFLIILSTFLPQTVNAAESGQPITIQACQSAGETNCIESIFATTPDGIKIKAELLSQSKNQWQLPGIKFEDGENTFQSIVDWRQDGQPLCWADTSGCSYHSGSIDLIFFPTSWTIPGRPIHFPHDTTDLQCGTKTLPTTCGMWLNFGIELKWDTVIRVSNFQLGMLSGRSKSAEIIDLDPAVPITNMHRFELIGTNYMQDTSVVNEVRSTTPGERQYADALSDGYIVWMWDANNDALNRISAQCRAIYIDGLVPHLMFNTYNMGNPTWDSVDRSLSVTVQSPHMTSTGSLASGYYEMFFPTKVAECLWGVKASGAYRAQISVTDSSGQLDLATVAQKIDNQGFTVITSNFHFSSPTIKVKFEDLPAAPVAPIAAPSDSSTQRLATITPIKPAQKIKVVVCEKGKSTKIVKGAKPVCPVGFKVKK
jgi:hypothetical protein